LFADSPQLLAIGVSLSDQMAVEACVAAKGEGNAAYAAGNLELAIERYTAALDHWNVALDDLPKPKMFSRGDCVAYNNKGFGRVESAFTVMDEYFLKDLGTDMPIWVGDAGGDLRRFSKSDLQPVPQELFDLRLACTQNMAAVKLKQEDFDLAIKWADEALRMDCRAGKALMRKGAALLKNGKAGPASDYLLTAKEVLPKDAEVKRLLFEAELARGAGWVCANGCCGPWGIQNHMLTPPLNLNTIGKGSTLGPTSVGPMRFGPTTAGQKIVADGEDSDSECSTCSSNDKADCSKNESPDLPDDLSTVDIRGSQPGFVFPQSKPVSAPSSEQVLKSGQALPEETALANDEPSGSSSAISASVGSRVAARPTAGVPATERAVESPDQKTSAEQADFLTKKRAASTAPRLCSTIAAASFAAFAAVAVAWQLGYAGAMPVA